MIDSKVLKLIKIQYSGDELAYHLAAWEQCPTLKKDCTIKRLEKAAIRSRFVKQLKAQKVN
jgi:hypothetical protein